MKPLKSLMTATLLVLSANLSAMDDDIPSIEGVINSIDNRHMTVQVEDITYQLTRSTRIFLDGTGQITFKRIKTGMRSRVMITNPVKFSKDGLPVLSSIILTELPDAN